jgi:hypothetical protein
MTGFSRRSCTAAAFGARRVGWPAFKGATLFLPDQFRAVRFGLSRTFVRGQQESSADAVAAIVLRFV